MSAGDSLRRKLVIVGDGACGKVGKNVLVDIQCRILTDNCASFPLSQPSDLSFDCLQSWNVPRGM